MFCEIARRRSFSKAAQTHGISQSAVSQAVHQLEQQLGVQLIDRSTRPLTLTKAGDRFQSGLVDILGRYQRLAEEVGSIGRNLTGQLQIAAIYSIGLSYMPDAKEEFARLYPDVEVRTHFGSNEGVIKEVMTGQAELGLVSFPRTSKEIVSVAWQKEPIRLVCAPGHPLASRTEVEPKDLVGLEMVGFESSLELRQMIDLVLRRAGVRVDFQDEFDNADSIVRAIQVNESAGFLPEAVVRRETANGALRVVACRALSMTRPLGIIFRRSDRPSRAGYEFGSMLLGRPLEPDREKRSSGSHRKPSSGPSIDGQTSIVA
ncbi:LysR family transcriptional regulator [Roseiconus lacunae]|uniref:LysR family transcriptional regulator n=1 Tax=Roseiconus lacunae TaxID=2605694 RepID=UPI001E322AA1|nr:LysR family transcriptional regulator [Roseiconus lacunae]MCD0459377.1 LysR family transcriptional regulator [Roseiconus lacunae]WRQ53880.1 LysR family transcriptional regulator [Stieleria sp. HD01]